jgi:tetratricopeptide (TPR) repeat protein
MVRCVYFVLALSLLTASSWGLEPRGVSAQVSEETVEKARRYFKQGLAFAKSNRWEKALASFRRSAELAPRASTSYNIANALYRLDRPVEGLAELDRYDALSEVRYTYAHQLRGEELRDLIEQAVAEVELEVTPEDAHLFVDGTLLPSLGVQRRLRLNPGTHSLRLTHENYAASFTELRVERGGRQSLQIALEPLPVATNLAPSVTAPDVVAPSVTATTVGASEEPQDDRERFVKRPGFWVMMGAIVVVGVGTGVAIALTRRDDSPQCGTTGDCATTSGLTLKPF